MSAIYGVAAALGVGVGDHFTRNSSDRATISQSLGAFLFGGFFLALTAAAVAGSEWRTVDLLIGAASGFIGVAALGALYLGYQSANVAVVGPPAAVLSVALPTVFSLLWGNAPSSAVLGGIALGVLSVLLITFDPNFTGDLKKGVLFSALSGVSYAALFVVLDLASPESGHWPMVSQRLVGFVVFAFLSKRATVSIFPDRRAVGLASLGAFWGGLGALSFLYGLQHGDLAPVAAAGTQYAAVTVACGWLFRGETLRLWQWLGLLGTMGSLTLIVFG